MAKKMNGFTIFLWSMLGTVAGAFVLGAFANVARDDEKKKDKDETTVETAVDFSIFSDPTKYTAEAVVPVEQGGQSSFSAAGKYVFVPSSVALGNLSISNSEIDEGSLLFGYVESVACVLEYRGCPIETNIQCKYYEPGPTVETPGTIFYFGEGAYNATFVDGYDMTGSFTYTITDETIVYAGIEGMYILTPTA